MRCGLVLLLLFSLCGSAQARASQVLNARRNDADVGLGFSRIKYGHNGADLPIWSPLTNFETHILKSRKALRSDNVDALLALYLLASGNVRTQAEFNDIQHRFDGWVTRIKANVMSTSGLKRRAHLVYRDMRRRFFEKNGASFRVPVGYDFNQSQLSEIFHTGKYNCISSAMLYILAAEAFGLHARGVLLPSHVFVQLDLGGGRHIEVETTVPGGFDFVHNKAYYARMDRQMSARLKIPPSTYEDYLHRSIVSPLELGLVDMDVQHTMPQRMSYQERMRLAEIRSTLAPKNLNAQNKRLYYYVREFNYFEHKRDYGTLTRFFEHVRPWLMSSSVNAFHNPDWQRKLAVVQIDMAFVLIEGHHGTDGVAVSRRLLEHLPSNLADYGKLRDALFSNIGQYVKNSVEQGHFARAKHALDGLEADCVHHENCSSSLDFLYSRWSEACWKKHNWSQVIQVLREYLRLDTWGANTRLINHNLESAYLNLATTHLHADDEHGAEDALMACVISAKGASRCRKELSELKAEGPR